jgi:nucleoside 2-deoxyribosyltransferase
MNLYIAHPITGLTGKETIDYFNKVKNELKDNFKILSPMTAKEHLYNDNICIANGYTDPICNNHAVFERDMWMVKQSDIVLCDFTGSEKVSIGCCIELGVASVLRKHTVVVMSKENIHNHCFILEASDIIFEKLDDAITYLKKI